MKVKQKHNKILTQITIKNCNPYITNIQTAWLVVSMSFVSIFVSGSFHPLGISHLREFTTSRITAVDIVKAIALDQRSQIQQIHKNGILTDPWMMDFYGR